jgi:hypothetical protein
MSFCRKLAHLNPNLENRAASFHFSWVICPLVVRTPSLARKMAAHRDIPKITVDFKESPAGTRVRVPGLGHVTLQGDGTIEVELALDLVKVTSFPIVLAKNRALFRAAGTIANPVFQPANWS